MTVLDLLSLTAAQLAARARQRLGKGHGPARRIHRDAIAGRFAPEDHGLVPATAAAWRRHFALHLPEITSLVEEPGPRGATRKALLRLFDGRTVECVHLPMGRGRSSLCLSTQVGCARACTFCETGRMGLLRNLTAAEITGQVVAARALLGWQPRTLVFMGMGEPLDNFDPLAQALAVLLDPAGLGFAQDRVTVCTAGNVPGIERLGALGYRRLCLSLSLNAADDALRGQIMPIARRHPLAEVQRALVDFRTRPNQTFGIHWCLMPGINDTRQDAAAVARFCAPLGRCMVHVIPYNPGTAPLCRTPRDDQIVRFVGWLREHGLPVRRRMVKGRSVMAACGQLGAVAGARPQDR